MQNLVLFHYPVTTQEVTIIKQESDAWMQIA